MRFYTKQHKYYCGIDLHTKKMFVCILDADRPNTAPPKHQNGSGSLSQHHNSLPRGHRGRCGMHVHLVLDR